MREEMRIEARVESERLLREKQRENDELKREVSRLWKGRLNGQLAYDTITSDDVWRVILTFV